MARITSDRIDSRVLGVDDNGNSLPIGIWGTVHNLEPTESVAARNSVPFADLCGVVTLISVAGHAHFKQGDSAVVATPDDVYLPEGVYIDALIPKGPEWSFISVISAEGSGAGWVQLIERCL